jgi:hypothetical protein
MEKGKGVMGGGRRWAVDFTDGSTSPSSRDIPDPLASLAHPSIRFSLPLIQILGIIIVCLNSVVNWVFW